MCNKEQISKVSKLIDKHYTLQKIHNKGVKDQLSDQKINNKRATRSDTTYQFLDLLKHNWINLGI